MGVWEYEPHHPHTPTRPHSQTAFTLLELLVVLVILMLLSSALVINFRGSLEEARLRSGTRTVIAMLRYARSYAVTNRQETNVILDADRRGVLVQIHDEDNTEAWRDLTTQQGRFRSLPDGVMLSEVRTGDEETSADATTHTITYTALGGSTDAEITLANDKGKALTITVDPLTGRCEIDKEADE